MFRNFIVFLLLATLAAPLAAQDATAPNQIDRSATGGAQTLQDILDRQNGLKINEDFRSTATGDPAGGAPTTDQLGTLGGISQAEDWRALRYGSADVTVSAGGDTATVLMQDRGMRWLQFRQGPLAKFATYLIGGLIVVLVLFYLIRGKIRIDGVKSGRTIVRFKSVERFGHWLLAGSFILLAITGLVSLFGRTVLIPLFGRETFSTIAIGSKWVHNNVSWAFILGLIMILVMWVRHNLPDRTDLTWMAKGGGILQKNVHPPAKKFNAGQKIIFWSVIVLGSWISLTGVSLLFPFEVPIFDATLGKLDAWGISQALGLGELATSVSPQAEMQMTQSWHAIIALVLLAIIIAHIYIGSIGMEGAYGAMGSGEVEEQWAREHHSLWVEDMQAKAVEPASAKKPAE